MRLIVLPLGDADPSAVAARLCAGLQVVDGRRVASATLGSSVPAEFDVFDRAELRRRPLSTLLRLLPRRYDEAVLVAPDLSAPRLRLTSLLLLLPRARRRRRLDLLGRDQTFSLGGHLRASGPAVARHLVGCGLALLLAYPLLSALDRLIRARPGAAPLACDEPAHPGPASRPGHGRPTQRLDLPTARRLGAPKPRPRPPRRVLYLRPQLWLGLRGGGSVAHTAGVIGGLQQAGLEVSVVASDSLVGVSAPTRVVRPECWFDGLGREAEELAFNVAFGRAAWACARRRKPDVLYQRHTAFNLTGALLSRVLGIPLVLEFNSSEVWKGQHWGGLRLMKLAALVERINLRAADLVVVVSRALREQLLEQGLVEPNRVLVNPNAVDPRQFRPDLAGTRVRARLGLQSSTVVGFSGTFGVWHGVPSLAAALPRVLAGRPQVRFLLIGDGPLRGLIAQVVERHGLQDRVVLTGLVPMESMPEYLAACDVLVSPHGRQVDGREFFGSPTKLYEYMAAGRAIVASGVGQIAEALTDGETALLVQPDDPDALAEAIVRLVDDVCLRTRLAAAARRHAAARHTWRQNAERLLRALDGGGWAEMAAAEEPGSPAAGARATLDASGVGPTGHQLTVAAIRAAGQVDEGRQR